MSSASQPQRSGCAILTGVFLIVVGAIALAHNLFGLIGVSSLRLAARTLEWFGTYWPLFFIVWGAYKIYVRVTHPERSHIGAAEVVILAFILVCGLAVRGAQRAMEELEIGVNWDEVAGVVGPELLGPAHHFTEQESFDLPSVDSLVVENERGELTITGWDETRVEVVVNKRVHEHLVSDAESAASDVSIDLETGEGRARLLLLRGEEGRRVFTDMELRVPKTMALLVRNDKGGVRLSNLEGAVEASTSHAPVEAENLAAGIKVETSHAPIRLEKIRGTAEARTRHGAVFATNIDGDLRAETRNASITVESVTGTAVLKTRHANVRAANVGAAIEIEAHHTEVSVENAGGGVSIATSNRPVFVSDVSGDVTLTTRNSSVVIRGVDGSLVIENQYRQVSVADVSGRVHVDGKQCKVDVESVGGAVSIESSDEDVRVSDFASSLEIRSTHAPVEVSTTRLSAAVSIETTYGDVELRLPGDTSGKLTAATRDGELRSDFSGVESRGESEGRRRWEGTLGAGAHALDISTSYGDIVLRKGAN